jgi:hypothetical protein
MALMNPDWLGMMPIHGMPPVQIEGKSTADQNIETDRI